MRNMIYKSVASSKIPMIIFCYRNMLFLIVVLLGLVSSSCKNQVNEHANPSSSSSSIEPELEVVDDVIVAQVIDYDTTMWTEITEDSGVVLDLRYATDNNFTEKQIYDCDRCFLRPELAHKMLQLQQEINNRYGYSLKMFDCYRPRPYQQRLWDIVPDARYVTPPKKGSMHNRGLAVDITLVDADGNELDMGTDFDHFGYKAYSNNTNLPEEVLKNRKVLSKLMNIHGLKGIRTEWWHYSLRSGQALKNGTAPLDSWVWDCPPSDI